MAPKRKTKRQEEEEDESDDVVVVDDDASDDDDDFDAEDESEDEKPKKKKAKKPAAASAKKEKAPAKPRKKAAKVEKVDIADLAAGAEGGEGVAPSPAKKAKAPTITEPTVLEDGFTAHPPSLLYKAFGEPNASTKIAAFDFDGTLVQTKSGRDFPMGAYDWALYNDQVVSRLQQYHKDGYRIVIFTNQGGVKSALAGAASSNFRQRVAAFLKVAGVPAVVLAATQRDELRKPERGMWDFYVERFLDGQAPELADSFFVGDSIDGGDEGFAGAVGLTFRSEKAEFGDKADPKAAGGGGGGGGAGGGGGGGGGPVEVTGTGQGPNAHLINVFQTLAQLARESGGDKSHFKVAALKKVADILQQYPHKVTADRIKEVSNIKGIGKASVDKIKEYLATGTVKALSGEGEEGGGGGGGSSSGAKTPAGKEGKALEGKGRADALQFM